MKLSIVAASKFMSKSEKVMTRLVVLLPNGSDVYTCFAPGDCVTLAGTEQEFTLGTYKGGLTLRLSM